MPYARRECATSLPATALWSVLLDGVANPERYVQGVTSSRILANHPDGLTRAVISGPRELLERVWFDEDRMELRFRLIGHRVFEGDYTQRVTMEDGQVGLEFEMDWLRIDGDRDDIDASELLDDAMAVICARAADYMERRPLRVVA